MSLRIWLALALSLAAVVEPQTSWARAQNPGRSGGISGIGDRVTVPSAAADRRRGHEGSGSRRGDSREREDYRQGYRDGYEDGDRREYNIARNRSDDAYERGYSKGYEAGYRQARDDSTQPYRSDRRSGSRRR
jgi:hypothetical protein